MQTKISLKQMKFPKVLAELIHSNQFLKIFSALCLAIVFLCLILVFVLVNRSPFILTFDTQGSVIESGSALNPEAEIRAAIRHYLNLRYQWTPEKVKEKLTQTQAMIHQTAMKAYLGSISNVIRFSMDKQVTQRVYGNKMDINLDRKIANISGDRVTTIQNLKVAGDLKLELTFEFGPRTKENPWGIYILKEVEIQN